MKIINSVNKNLYFRNVSLNKATRSFLFLSVL